MADIYARSNGAVALIRGAGQGLLSNIDVEGASRLGGNDANVLITSVAVSQAVKMAYFPTIGDSLYVYPLGNDISRCQITRLALPVSACSGGGGGYTSADKIMKFYEKNRASSFSRLAKPVKLVMPPVSLEGFIEGMDAQVSADSGTFGFVRFSLRMSIIPPVRD